MYGGVVNSYESLQLKENVKKELDKESEKMMYGQDLRARASILTIMEKLKRLYQESETFRIKSNFEKSYMYKRQFTRLLLHAKAKPTFTSNQFATTRKDLISKENIIDSELNNLLEEIVKKKLGGDKIPKVGGIIPKPKPSALYPGMETPHKAESYIPPPHPRRHPEPKAAVGGGGLYPVMDEPGGIGAAYTGDGGGGYTGGGHTTGGYNTGGYPAVGGGPAPYTYTQDPQPAMPSYPVNQYVYSPSVPALPVVEEYKAPLLTPTSTVYDLPTLHSLYIPSSLVSHFVSKALSNTANNIETCGIMCGREKDDGYMITDIIIPKQTGSHDMCNMIDEEELFFFQDSKMLLTLGWIHTHPQYDAFLSSVDLHTQFSYQKLLEESIAIVYSPIDKKAKMQSFRIKDEYLPVIGKCAGTGFHKHAVPNNEMFENTKHHIIFDAANEKVSVNIHDFRFR